MPLEYEKVLTGRRVYANDEGALYTDKGLTQPTAEVVGEIGDYWFWVGQWWGRCPTGSHCGLKNHQVQEHADGTISVQPSILISPAGAEEYGWHGYLTNGVWRTC